ncbi:MAG: hypothetical protein R3F43_06635 [bacterium]
MRATLLFGLTALALGCSSYQARIEAPRDITVGKRTSVYVQLACSPGAVGCGRVDSKIRRFEVAPKSAVTGVEREGTNLLFVPVQAGWLTLTLEIVVDGEVQHAQRKVEAKVKR